MRAVVLGTILSLALALPAFAEEDVMAARYGNTTDSVDAKGIHTKIYYSADHSFKAAIADLQVHGTWKIENGNVCLTFVDPPANLPSTFPTPTCLPVTAHKFGDTWTSDEDNKTHNKNNKPGIQ